jgi:hypothetical protein
MTEESRFDIRQGLRFIVLETLPSTQPSFYWMSAVKVSRHEPNHSNLLPELRKLETSLLHTSSFYYLFEDKILRSILEDVTEVW